MEATEKIVAAKVDIDVDNPVIITFLVFDTQWISAEE
jgi:hypothetical protein